MRTTVPLSIVIFALFVVIGAGAASAQSRQDTEKRLRALQDQMTLDVIRLSETEELEKASLQTLNDIERQIAVRTELIATNELLLSQIEQSRDSIAASMRVLEKELDYHRKIYQERAVHAYKYGRLHDVALILAARSINQMLIRVRYLSRFADDRKSRFSEIKKASDAIEARRNEIAENEKKAQELIVQYRTEAENMKSLRAKRNEVISELRSQRSSIQKDLEQKQREEQQLQSLVRNIITTESNRRAAAPPVDEATAAANAELSGAFSANKGKIPWPAEGVVTEPFGQIVNPLYGTVTNNPGILVSTTASAQVTAVFDGEVSEIYPMPEYGRIITISHGEYTSLYGNLSLLYVEAGTVVKAGQLIGRAGTESEPKGNAVFFAIFRNGAEIDPQTWLRRR
ncbi:MAG: peptidoglycan DD-metalloendopeptidase family protein [Rhodothermales bacterium]|nr:peptidoglycan DD-metalloendopeptidase family protein [Rhodothermales bacterium]